MRTTDSTRRDKYGDLIHGDVFQYLKKYWVVCDRGAVSLKDGSCYADFNDSHEIYFKGHLATKRYCDIDEGTLFNGCWLKGPAFATNIATGETIDGIGNVVVRDDTLNVATMELL